MGRNKKEKCHFSIRGAKREREVSLLGWHRVDRCSVVDGWNWGAGIVFYFQSCTSLEPAEEMSSIRTYIISGGSQ